MIALLVSFELIQIAYLQEVDPQQHIVMEEKNSGVFTVIKNGIAWRELLQQMKKIKDNIMEDQVNKNFGNIVFVCFSAKGKSIAQPIFKALSQEFQAQLIYFLIDKQRFQNIPFNRAILKGNQICYGQGFSQLKTKQELRSALSSVLKLQGEVQYVFVQKNANQLKQLKKEGFSNIVDIINVMKFREVFQKSQQQLKQRIKADEPIQQVRQIIQNYKFAKQYLKILFKSIKQQPVKAIYSFAIQKLTILNFINELYKPSLYYNITPKSWISRPLSRQICSYIFHNASDGKLYIARSSKPKDHSNEEQYELKILNYYLGFLVDPTIFAVPHDKHSTLMKFCKIKAYENKKAYLNIRPYIEELQTINHLNLSEQDYLDLVKKGQLRGRKVRGFSSIYLASWLVNESFDVKTWSEQVCLIELNQMDGNYKFVNKDNINSSQGDLALCRTDYFSIFNSSNYKVVEQNNFVLHRFVQGQLTVSLSDFGQVHLQEMLLLLQNICQERVFMIKNLFLYYRWNTKLADYYQIIDFRLQAIRSYFQQYKYNLSEKKSLLNDYPKLACLLMPKSYEKFMLPLENEYFPLQYSYQQQTVVKKTIENPYLSYINKTCSFAIYNIDFPVFSFLQWVKSTNKYQVIEYISMMNHNIEQLQILEKRLKLQAVNDKKNVILVVDHMEFAESIIDKPKGVKTVMIFRIKKASEMGDIGLITAKMDKIKTIEESQDQLLIALNHWGLKSDLFTSKFQLYDWVLETFIKIKCSLYDFSLEQSQQFFTILHKAISTNKNRLRELQQTHKEQFKYLYTYPITKQNQKIVLNYRIFEYFHIRSLFMSVLNEQWNHKLLPYQNSSLSTLRQFFDGELGVRLVKKLIQYLNFMTEQHIDGFNYQSNINDTLQVIKTIANIYKPIEGNEQVYALWYEVFPDVVKIHNYFKIKTTILVQDILVVVNDENIQLIKGENTCKIETQNQEVLSLTSYHNNLLYISRKDQYLFLTQIQINKETQLSYQIKQKIKISNIELNALLVQDWQKVLINKDSNNLAIILYRSKQIVVLFLNLATQELSQTKRYPLDHQVVSLQVISSPQPMLLTADYQSLYFISLDSNSSPAHPSLLLTVNYGLSNLFFYSEGKILHIFSYKLHVVEHIILTNNQIIHQKKHEFPRNIRTLSVKAEKLLVFYENCDSLDIFQISQDSINRLHTFFWVDPSVQQIFLAGKELYLRGASYVKHVRLRSRSFLEAQSMSGQ